MSNYDIKKLIVNLINSGSTSPESSTHLKNNLSILCNANIEGSVINPIEASRALFIYERRIEALRMEGKKYIGHDELLTSGGFNREVHNSTRIGKEISCL